MRKKSNSILLLGGPHHGQWYVEKYGVLRVGDGITMRDGARYIVDRWPTGEYVGIEQNGSMDQSEYFNDPVQASTLKMGQALGSVAFSITKDLAVDYYRWFRGLLPV